MKKGMVVLVAGLLFMGGCATSRHAAVQDQTATSQDEDLEYGLLHVSRYSRPQRIDSSKGKELHL